MPSRRSLCVRCSREKPMKLWRILHISDLHIHDVEGAHEHLRKDFYDEYLRELAATIRKKVAGSIDCVTASGDFVDQGQTENFAHAKRVVCFLAEELNLGPEKVIVCPGNHDVIKSYEIAGRPEKARE